MSHCLPIGPCQTPIQESKRAYFADLAKQSLRSTQMSQCATDIQFRSELFECATEMGMYFAGISVVSIPLEDSQGTLEVG